VVGCGVIMGVFAGLTIADRLRKSMVGGVGFSEFHDVRGQLGG